MNRWQYRMWLAAWILAWTTVSPVQADVSVVRAVLFYSPTCPHCYQVITEDLPPLLEKYGDQVQIIGVDTSSPGGQVLFQSAIERFNIPPEHQGVPMLIVGETILIGALEIPEQFPALVERCLAQDGIDWPDIPGLRDALATGQPESSATPTPTLTPGAASHANNSGTATPQPEPTLTQEILPVHPPTAEFSATQLSIDANPGLGERLARDPLGNTLAIMVLVGMLFSLAATFNLLRPATALVHPAWPSIWIPVLCLIGMFVASYLAYVETAQVLAVCGPVGDCNTVQQSEYARLFGVLPIGVLGLAGYLAILGAWLVGRYGSKRLASLASLALLGLTLFGVLFSVYLTFLEPFVIGATCAWCLASAAIMTLLLWLSLAPGKSALSHFVL